MWVGSAALGSGRNPVLLRMRKRLIALLMKINYKK